MKKIKTKKHSPFSTLNSQLRKGFTFIEMILYVAIVSIVLTALIIYAWSVIGIGEKSAVQQEVSSNARYISERIKYEIRNSLGINSFSSTQIVLCQTSGSCATNPTTITFSSPNLTIQNKGATAVNLNSNDVVISGFSFTDYTDNVSGNKLTKHIAFSLTVQSVYTGPRKEFKDTITLESSAEVRSN